MKPYELLEHTADAKFRAYGKTLEEAFANAVSGMSAIVADPATLRQAMHAHVSVTGADLHKLLFNLLDELLFRMDTEHLLPATVERMTIVQEDGRYRLEADIAGDDVRDHGGNLKAVTYSEMLVEQQADGTWLLQAVIDI